jgi:hypothetical protein
MRVRERRALRAPFVRTAVGAIGALLATCSGASSCSDPEEPVACAWVLGHPDEEGAACAKEGETCGGHCDLYSTGDPTATCIGGTWHRGTVPCNPPCTLSPCDTGVTTRDTALDAQDAFETPGVDAIGHDVKVDE